MSRNRKNCIELKISVFGLPSPDIVESEFEGGIISGIVNLTWIEKNVQMTAYTQNGQLHGIFRAYDKVNDRWMIGTLVRNELLRSFEMNCWIIEKQMVKI